MLHRLANAIKHGGAPARECRERGEAVRSWLFSGWNWAPRDVAVLDAPPRPRGRRTDGRRHDRPRRRSSRWIAVHEIESAALARDKGATDASASRRTSRCWERGIPARRGSSRTTRPGPGRAPRGGRTPRSPRRGAACPGRCPSPERRLPRPPGSGPPGCARRDRHGAGEGADTGKQQGIGATYRIGVRYHPRGHADAPQGRLHGAKICHAAIDDAQGHCAIGSMKDDSNKFRCLRGPSGSPRVRAGEAPRLGAIAVASRRQPRSWNGLGRPAVTAAETE